MKKRNKLQRLMDEQKTLNSKIAKSQKSTQELKEDAAKLEKEIQIAQMEELNTYLLKHGLTIEELHTKLSMIDNFLLSNNRTLEEFVSNLGDISAQ